MTRRLASVGVVLAVLAVLVAAGWGLARMQWPQALPTRDWSLDQYALFLGAMTLAVALANAMLGWRTWATVLLFGAVAVLLSSLWPAAAAALLVLVASAVVGSSVLALLGRRDGAPWWASMLAGAGVYGSVIGVAAAWRVHFPWVYMAAFALPVVLGHRQLKVAALQICALRKQTQPVSTPVAAVNALTGAIALLHLVIALLPELGQDALAVHLFVGNQLVVKHVWGYDIQKYVWAVMPMLADWIFAAAQMLGGEIAARLLNVAFLGIVVALVRELVIWCGGGAAARRWATLLLLTLPLTYTLSSSVFIELAWTTFVLAGTLAVLRLVGDDGHPRELLLAGFWLGLAAAAKAVTFTILPVLLLVVLARPRRWWSRAGAWWLVAGVALLVLLGGFPYINAWLRTGNPVFPFFNASFRSPLYPIENFDSAGSFSRGLDWTFPYSVAFQSIKYIEGLTGAGGFQWLLVLLPAAVAVVLGGRWRAAVVLAVATCSIAVTFQSVAYLRYVFPAIAMTCAVAGVALGDARWGRVPRTALATGAAAAVALNLLFIGAASPYRDFAISSIPDQAKREAWLDLRMPLRRAITLVNQLNGGAGPVVVIGSPVLGHLASDALMPSWYNFSFYNLLRTQQTPRDLVTALQGLGVEYVLMDGNPGHEPKASELLLRTTEPVGSYGAASVRRWTAEYRFAQEMLANPHFQDGAGWSSTEAPRKGQGVVVTVQAPAVQSVPVQPDRRYLNEITVVCPTPALARAQVNWASAGGEFLKTDIRVVECGPQAATHQMEVVAPPRAAIATVYAGGHTEAPVEFKVNSFRR
ncbi:MAG: hypothetical protein JWQ88_2272 [Rhodoferax sp.]|nr:hypothetical protein [Rhodoferax sp.]